MWSCIWGCIHPNVGHRRAKRTLQQKNHYTITISDDCTTNNNNVDPKSDNEEESQVEKRREVINDILGRPCSKKLRGAPRESSSIKRIGAYTNMQKILLVGEGDFSFSTSLAVAFGSASNIIATSLNSQDFLSRHYSEFLTNKMKLVIRGCLVIHGVDATNMVEHSVLGSLRFDCIIFNFPHTGNFGGSQSDMSKNRNLVKGFLRSAKKMIEENGEIHITHKSNGFFRKWDIPKIGSDQGLYLFQEIDFSRTVYPGYHTKYGFGGNKNFNCNPSITYKFRMYPN